MGRILGFPLLPLGGLPLGEHLHDDFPLTKRPPLDFLGKEVLWKGGEIRTVGGMTIEGPKEQEDMTWS